MASTLASTVLGGFLSCQQRYTFGIFYRAPSTDTRGRVLCLDLDSFTALKEPVLNTTVVTSKVWACVASQRAASWSMRQGFLLLPNLHPGRWSGTIVEPEGSCPVLLVVALPSEGRSSLSAPPLC